MHEEERLGEALDEALVAEVADREVALVEGAFVDVHALVGHLEVVTVADLGAASLGVEAVVDLRSGGGVGAGKNIGDGLGLEILDLGSLLDEGLALDLDILHLGLLLGLVELLEQGIEQLRVDFELGGVVDIGTVGKTAVGIFHELAFGVDGDKVLHALEGAVGVKTEVGEAETAEHTVDVAHRVAKALGDDLFLRVGGDLLGELGEELRIDLELVGVGVFFHEVGLGGLVEGFAVDTHEVVDGLVATVDVKTLELINGGNGVLDTGEIGEGILHTIAREKGFGLSAIVIFLEADERKILFLAGSKRRDGGGCNQKKSCFHVSVMFI